MCWTAGCWNIGGCTPGQYSWGKGSSDQRQLSLHPYSGAAHTQEQSSTIHIVLLTHSNYNRTARRYNAFIPTLTENLPLTYHLFIRRDLPILYIMYLFPILITLVYSRKSAEYTLISSGQVCFENDCMATEINI